MSRVLRSGLHLLLLALAVLLPDPGALRADEEPPEEPPAEPAPEQPEVREATDEEARRLTPLLDRARRRRKAEDVLPVLEEVRGLSHERFHKPLLKLLAHESAEVALAAADLLAAQIVEEERDAQKLAKSIWKYGWEAKPNDRRYVVKGRVLEALVAHDAEPLDERRGKDLERAWRAVTGSPAEALAPALVSLCRYVQTTKDKRLCRLLAEEIDEPYPEDVNSPTNPPQAWWEGRWKLWNLVKGPVVDTLEVLTGEVFKSTQEAKDWFEANEREFGFDW